MENETKNNRISLVILLYRKVIDENKFENKFEFQLMDFDLDFWILNPMFN